MPGAAGISVKDRMRWWGAAWSRSVAVLTPRDAASAVSRRGRPSSGQKI